MQHSLQHTMSLLTRTPIVLNALLPDRPEAWMLKNEGETTWSALDILGHLIYGERTDWMPRARRKLTLGLVQKSRSDHARYTLSHTLVQELGMVSNELRRKTFYFFVME